MQFVSLKNLGTTLLGRSLSRSLRKFQSSCQPGLQYLKKWVSASEFLWPLAVGFNSSACGTLHRTAYNMTSLRALQKLQSFYNLIFKKHSIIPAIICRKQVTKYTLLLFVGSVSLRLVYTLGERKLTLPIEGRSIKESVDMVWTPRHWTFWILLWIICSWVWPFFKVQLIGLWYIWKSISSKPLYWGNKIVI